MNEEIRHAAEAAKSPLSYDLITYAWVVLLSMWGGTVRFVRKVRDGAMSLKQASFTFIGEVTTSAFAGVITFYICEVSAITPLMTAVFVGIAGHMGGRALEPLEALYKRWIGSDKQ